MIPKYFKRSPKKLFVALALSLASVPAALAQVFTVADIRLEGLQRISASAVFGLLNIRVGDQIERADIERRMEEYRQMMIQGGRPIEGNRRTGEKK